MRVQVLLGDITVDVILKDINNIHLSVYPPDGAVRISAPSRMSIDSVRAYAISKLRWIKKQQKKLRSQERISPREYIDGESHYLWGKRFLLRVIESSSVPRVEIRARHLEMYVRPGSDRERRADVMQRWLRSQLKSAVPPIILKWEQKLSVEVSKVYVQRMKTKWGSCNFERRTIRLNTELSEKPRECLEYVLVHEMMHLLEPTHSRRFHNLMDQHFPKWKFYKDELNKLPTHS
ncbi:SprT family zinc-dependent metalloprotease [Geitlerinema splendidum]|nr:SprT family zinc-dependent metalloprotease [Geitlerinema splendidum]